MRPQSCDSQTHRERLDLSASPSEPLINISHTHTTTPYGTYVQGLPTTIDQYGSLITNTSGISRNDSSPYLWPDSPLAMSERTSLPTSDPEQVLPYDSQHCLCMACLFVGVPNEWTEGMWCRFLSCTFTTNVHSDYIAHERDHFHDPGNPLYRCVEQYCPFTSKRWPDLIRHYKVKHCKKPKEFPCPVPWCRFSGDGGFARKDKLMSHCKNVHQPGLMQSVHSVQNTVPAVAGSQGSAGPGLGHGSMI